MKQCPELVPEAQAIRDKFCELLKLFATCHFKYNGSKSMKEEEITILGSGIFKYTSILCPAFAHNS